MNKILKSFIFVLCISSIFILSNSKVNAQEKISLNVFNWGEYIDMSVIKDFEALYPNIDVIYETYDSNESMYTKLTTGDANYDVIIPSDYMLEKLIKEEWLLQLDYGKIPNRQYVRDDLLEKLEAEFSNDTRDSIAINDYAVPYFWGTVGILYDTDKVKKTVDSWEILWDEDYKKQIYMYDSQRDSLMVALKLLGYSMNSTNREELEAAKDLLIEQKPLVYAYVTDTVIRGMIDGEAALAVVYSGDAAYIMDESKYNLDFVIPKEGTNFWFDLMAIPKTSKNVDAAHKFINFMCDPEIALKNTEEVMYSSPIELVFNDVIEEEWANNIAYNPTNIDAFGGEIQTEIFRDPGEFIKTYDEIWSEVLSDGNYIIPLIIGGVILVGIGVYLVVFKKRKKRY